MFDECQGSSDGTHLLLCIKPIFHCDAKPLTLGPRFGLDPKHHNFALGKPTCWYLKSLKFALPPTLTPKANRWNIGRVGSPTQDSRVGHIHLIFLVDFIRVGTIFQWNMGLRDLTLLL